MKVKELVRILERFPPEAPVHLGVSLPGCVAEVYEQVWVADGGQGPQINAALDLRGSTVYVGLLVPPRPRSPRVAGVDLGRYENSTDAARVHDFYVIHKGLKEPLHFPDFNYEKWIPPRTTSGQYNEHIAKILREKLMRD
jgi:hypothetical protein